MNPAPAEAVNCLLNAACTEKTKTTMTDQEDSLGAELVDLQQKHRDLDSEIARLESFPYQDQLLLRRLKKEKLRIKDCIARVRTLMIPDLDA